MLYIEKISYRVPEQRIPVYDMERLTGASKSTLRIFESFYGLKNIAVEEEMNCGELIESAVEQFSNESFEYVVHCHASREVAPHSLSINNLLNETLASLKPAFGSTMMKCVSPIGFLETLDILMNNKSSTKSLLITADVAFTPEMRTVPRATICGDAATASVLSNDGTQNRLIAVETAFMPGFSKGIYLETEKIQEFDLQFMQMIKNTISRSLEKAQITLEQVSLILPHNVNYPTWNKIAEALEIPYTKIYSDNIREFGHCLASDGILNLALAMEEKRLQKNDYFLMVGCGLGVFFASAVFQH